jgi:hypothetical protein
MIHSNSTTRKIVEYIRANPGSTRPMMMSVLPDGTKPHTVSSILGHLSKGGVVQNLGRSGRAARWFPVQIVVDKKFRKIARQLVEELKNVHHTQREDYLALRLQEIFGGEN